jgi:hypothetical protein
MKELSKGNQEILKAYEKGYTVNKEGEVFNPQGKKRILCVNSSGYYFFNISSNKKARNIKVHRFIGYFKYKERIFEDGLCIRHLDGNSKNNNWDNIAIGTYKDNMMDKPVEVRMRCAKHASTFIRRFTDEQVKAIRKDKYENNMTYKQLCEKYNTSKSTLSYLFNNAQY